MSALTLQRAAVSPEGESNRAEDLEKTPVDRVLAALAVQPDKGLSSAEARERLTKYGPNAIVEKEISLARKILQHFIGPIAYMIEAAAIVSAIIAHWDDFVIITGLLLFNAALEFWQDHKSSNASRIRICRNFFRLADAHQLQTVMFLQLASDLDQAMRTMQRSLRQRCLIQIN